MWRNYVIFICSNFRFRPKKWVVVHAPTAFLREGGWTAHFSTSLASFQLLCYREKSLTLSWCVFVGWWQSSSQARRCHLYRCVVYPSASFSARFQGGRLDFAEFHDCRFKSVFSVYVRKVKWFAGTVTRFWVGSVLCRWQCVCDLVQLCRCSYAILELIILGRQSLLTFECG